nr:hypothetical protein [Chania multitudinisentens]
MLTPIPARLYLPSPALAGCIHMAVERDTRGLQLSDEQRYSFYPASPLPLISWVLEGDLRIVEGSPGKEVRRLAASSPRLGLIGPFRKPAASWAPGAVHALWVSIYPDALSRLWSIRAEDYMDRVVPLEGLVPDATFDALARIGTGDEPSFQQIESALRPQWSSSPVADASTADLRAWIASLPPRTALPKAGAGLRQIQRRIKDHAGQSQRDLQIFAALKKPLRVPRLDMAKPDHWPRPLRTRDTAINPIWGGK